MATSRRPSRRQPVRSPQARKPGAPARAVEPPDYTREYGYVRKDLILIAIIGGLLFAGMVAMSFVI
jgi:hypothetical protein